MLKADLKFRLNTYALCIQPVLTIPPKEDLQSLGLGQSDVFGDWTPYPLPTPIMKSFENALLESRCRLSLIVNPISIFLLQIESTGISISSVAQAMILFKRLDDWYGGLSHELIIEHDPTPHKIILQ